MQDQNNLNQSTSSVQQITDVPPMPDFLAPTPPPAPPSTDPNYFPPNGNTTSNKKFGKGKIIATFLGILLLVAGITTGIILVLQPQLLQQKAVVPRYDLAPICATGLNCLTTQIPGSSGCLQSSTSTTQVYCCGQGQVYTNGACTSGGTIHCVSDTDCLGNNKCNPGTGTCESLTGVGNCKDNTGSCYVHTSIGLQDLNGGQDGPYGERCEWGGHWTTCATGYTCSNYDCIPQNVPNPTSPPSSNPPSNPPQPTPVPTPTRSPSPSPTPSPTPTRSPSPTPVPQCNSVCTTSLNCPSGMICSTGFCRNPSCTSQTNCLCPTPSPSPTPTRSPSPTPSPTPVPQCNSTCTSTSQCLTGQTCSIPSGATSGNCRNPSCTSQTNCLCPTATPTPIPSPTPGPTAICSSVKAYDSAWTLLSSTDLSNLRAGNNIQFCVAGTTTGESFDMARFTINGTLQANTTTKRPTSNDFCQAYTIPANVYTFSVTAEIHHTSLGWVGP